MNDLKVIVFSIIAIVVFAVLCLLGLLWLLIKIDNLPEPPCSEYADYPLRSLPARCTLNYDPNGK